MAKDLFPAYSKAVIEELSRTGVTATQAQIREQFEADASIEEAIVNISVASTEGFEKEYGNEEEESGFEDTE